MRSNAPTNEPVRQYGSVKQMKPGVQFRYMRMVNAEIGGSGLELAWWLVWGWDRSELDRRRVRPPSSRNAPARMEKGLKASPYLELKTFPYPKASSAPGEPYWPGIQVVVTWSGSPGSNTPYTSHTRFTSYTRRSFPCSLATRSLRGNATQATHRTHVGLAGLANPSTRVEHTLHKPHTLHFVHAPVVPAIRQIGEPLVHRGPPCRVALSLCDHWLRFCSLPSNRSRVEGNKRTEAHGAAKIPPACVGRCDRRALARLRSFRGNRWYSDLFEEKT